MRSSVSADARVAVARSTTSHSPCRHCQLLEQMVTRLADAGAQEVGQVQKLGDEWSLFFRDPDGMELEVCCPVDA